MFRSVHTKKPSFRRQSRSVSEDVLYLRDKFFWHFSATLR